MLLISGPFNKEYHQNKNSLLPQRELCRELALHRKKRGGDKNEHEDGNIQALV